MAYATNSNYDYGTCGVTNPRLIRAAGVDAVPDSSTWWD
jgi:hypothetical protein